ncbi:SN protein, partial [Nothoprocta ornata]|nr:SN protein [Nothoprocta ornata]
EPRRAGRRGAAPAARALLSSTAVRVTVEPSEEVAEGAAVTLRCRVPAWLGAAANVTWYKDGRWLRDGPDDTLLLPPVSSADAGSYRCRASGTGGAAASVPASLSVTCECRGLQKHP